MNNLLFIYEYTKIFTSIYYNILTSMDVNGRRTHYHLHTYTHTQPTYTTIEQHLFFATSVQGTLASYFHCYREFGNFKYPITFQ